MLLFNRQILPTIKRQLKNNKVLILTGARQTGKTSILKIIQEKILPPNQQRFYFDLEKEEQLQYFTDYKTLMNYLILQGINLKKRLYLFIDEFQKITNLTKIFKIIYDHYSNIKIIASGSSSLEISRKITESLTGRKRVLKIYPLSFQEYLLFKQSGLLTSFEKIKPSPQFNVLLKEFSAAFEEFAIFGGYPAVSLQPGALEKKEELEDIYNDYLQKDIKAFLKLQNVIGFNKLVRLLAAQTGNLLNVNNLSGQSGLARQTAEHHLFILENTFIIKTIPAFFTNKQKEIVKMPKIYFFDNGLRNFALRNFTNLEIRADKGALAENIALTEILKHKSLLQEVYFWRTRQGAEVDLVIVEGDKLLPIEVKYQTMSAPKIPSGLKAFINQYNPSRAFVLTKDFISKAEFGNCQINFLPIFLTAKIFQ